MISCAPPLLFNSLTFIAFFVVVLGVQRTRIPWALKKALLLAASWLFYSAARPELLVLLIASTVGNWGAGRAIAAASTNRARRAWLVLAILLNAGTLATFKYSHFLVDNLAIAAQALGIHWTPPEFSLPLPVGVSFYTFQALSYVIDIYRGQLAPSRSLLDFSLYAAFFPHLVAGPIVRASLFLPQLEVEHRPTAAEFERGAFLFVFGLFQKVVLADALLAPVADAVFATGAQPDFVASWCGTFAFTGQIFCDFAGYTTAAIGAAAMLGFTLNENFRRPYGASTFSDFWHRWHISLSSWLRDYLYFPLGGSRLGRVRTYVNIMVVMLIGGLWHGASWTFVVWGGLNGLFITLERMFDAQHAPKSAAARTARWILTIFGVAVARVFFRSRDFGAAMTVFNGLLGRTPSAGALHLDSASILSAVTVTSGVILAHRLAPDLSLDRLTERLPRPCLAAALSICFISFVVLARPDRAFIYFQF